MHARRTTFAILLLAAVSSSSPAQAAQPEENAGHAASEKEMKPYAQAIPGTKVKFDMVPIPSGRFTMGSPESEKGRKKDEGPPIEVEVEAMWVGKHEVTWDEFLLFSTQYAPAMRARWKDGKRNEIPKDKTADAVSIPTPMWEQDMWPILRAMGQKDGYPACAMSQFSAQQYTKWLSKMTGRFYRLPTEAEWEYACRAGTKTAFAHGDDAEKVNDYAWNFYNSDFNENLDLGHPEWGAAYRKVGLKKPNAWGLYDMHGNVSEWCIDQYVADHYATFKGRTVKAKDAVAWRKSIYPGVARGGDWTASQEECRSAARFAGTKRLNDKDPNLPPSYWWLTDGYHIGFRVVRPLKEPSEEAKRKYWDPEVKEIRQMNEAWSGSKEIRVLVEPAKEEKAKDEKLP